MEFMAAFHKFPKEGAIIGELIAGYGELEFLLAVCVGRAVGDTDTALRALFRLRSETNKIEVGAALMEGKYASVGLAVPLQEALKALRFCRNARNQYAHSQWGFGPRGLWFSNLESSANASEAFPISWTLITLPLLQKQEAYFNYTSQYLEWLQSEYNFKSGTMRTNIWPKPPAISEPKLHSQRARLTHPGTDIDLSVLPPEDRQEFLNKLAASKL